MVKQGVVLLRVTEAAKILGVKPASVRQLERRGLLHACRDWNGHRRFLKTEVERFRKKLVAPVAKELS